MTNLDFVAQVTGRKHHFFNLYSHPSGDHFVQPNNFFTLRGGYKDKEGNRGIKVLWRGGGERGELAPFATRKMWNPKAVYTWLWFGFADPVCQSFACIVKAGDRNGRV